MTIHGQPPEHGAPHAHEALVARARRGDAAALDTLWRSERRLVAAVVLAATPRLRPDELEDVVQDVSVRFVRGIVDVDAAGAFRGWLRQVARTAALDAARRRSALGRSIPAVSDEPDRVDPDAVRTGVPRDDVGHELDVRERVEAVMRGLGDLPEHWREVLWLRAVKGLGQQDIADALGLSVTTVESRLARARRAMRGRFGEPEPGRSAATRPAALPCGARQQERPQCSTRR